MNSTGINEDFSYIPASYYLKSFDETFQMIPHIHDYYEIMYAVKGHFYIKEFSSKNPVTSQVSEGQLVFINRNIPHCLIIEEKCKICNLEIAISDNQYNFSNSNLMNRIDEIKDFMNNLETYIVFTDHENILATLKKIYQGLEKDTKDITSFIYFSMCMVTLFIDMARSYHSSKNKYMSLYIVKALNIIDNNFTEHISPKEISQKLNISESYLHRLFKSFLNTTFINYVNKKRVELAKHLLSTTNNQINYIYANVGFESRQNFNKAFTKFIGLSPQQFRTANKKLEFNVAIKEDYDQKAYVDKTD